MRRVKRRVIASQKLLGILLLSLAAIFMCGPWLRQFRGWIEGFDPLVRGCTTYAIVGLNLAAALAGLDLGFGYRPLGIDHHHPWTYVNVIASVLIVDAMGGDFAWYLTRKQAYSAVSDDWLLWDKQPKESATS